MLLLVLVWYRRVGTNLLASASPHRVFDAGV